MKREDGVLLETSHTTHRGGFVLISEVRAHEVDGGVWFGTWQRFTTDTPGHWDAPNPTPKLSAVAAAAYVAHANSRATPVAEPAQQTQSLGRIPEASGRPSGPASADEANPRRSTSPADAGSAPPGGVQQVRAGEPQAPGRASARAAVTAADSPSPGVGGAEPGTTPSGVQRDEPGPGETHPFVVCEDSTPDDVYCETCGMPATANHGPSHVLEWDYRLRGPAQPTAHSAPVGVTTLAATGSSSNPLCHEMTDNGDETLALCEKPATHYSTCCGFKCTDHTCRHGRPTCSPAPERGGR